MLLSLLLPDPCDPLCPGEFKVAAQSNLPRVACNPGATEEDLRKGLLQFLGRFANWELGNERTHVDVGRALVRAAYGEEIPLLVDPFAGGGSIPVEGLRLGCDVFASDLNPVACLILKAMLEDIPRYGVDLAARLRQIAERFVDQVASDLAAVYPPDADGAQPIAYLWARTVRCEAPGCGAEIPLLRNRWLLKAGSRKRALKLEPDAATKAIRISVFRPAQDSDVQPGTIRRSRARCLHCGSALAQSRIQMQLQEQHGGGDVELDDKGRRVGRATLLAVVIKKDGIRDFRACSPSDYEAIAEAESRLERLESDHAGLIANEPLSRVPVSFGVINVWVYGVGSWGDLFSKRQKLVLANLVAQIRALPRSSPEDRALSDLVALTVSRFTDDYSNMMRWMDRGTPSATFARPALPMVWDFCEIAPFDDASWSLHGSFDWVAKAVEGLRISKPGQVQRINAQQSPLPDEAATVWFTDPPYYDNIPYSYLSDYFYVWLRRSLVDHPLFCEGSGLTSKEDEIVAYIGSDGDARAARRGFESALSAAFLEGKRVLDPNGIGSVVFAHQTTEGWEALLSALSAAGWVITASWPIATERRARPRAHESAALATSVHLVCRPRSDAAPVGDWSAVLRELPVRVGYWMERLQAEGIRGADLVFACIGPALEVFSRYSKVETAEGTNVSLAAYLERVWEVVGRAALSQILGTAEARARNGAAGAVEEDARLTALFLWTIQTTGFEQTRDVGDEATDVVEASPDEDEDHDDEMVGGKPKGLMLVHDVVRRFAQPLGIDLREWEGRIIETKKGVVRLIPVGERAKQLFGEDGGRSVAEELERQSSKGTSPLQQLLFSEMEDSPRLRSRARISPRHVGTSDLDPAVSADRQATTLDRVHAGMLFQAAGRTNALRALVKAEQERGPDFLRLANALAALYPPGCEEKRLLEAMLVGAR